MKKIICLFVALILFTFNYESTAQLTQTIMYAGPSISADGSTANAPLSGFNFPAGYVVDEVSISIAFSSTGGTCPSPGNDNAYHNDIAFRLNGTSSSLTLADDGRDCGSCGEIESTWNGCDNVSVVVTFDDGNAVPSGAPANGTYGAVGGSLDATFAGQAANDGWSLDVIDDCNTTDPVCVSGFSITVTAVCGDNSADADCDGVGDLCDVCPNGDDTVDYNGDGLPDCSPDYFPGKDNVDPSWLCSNNGKKIYICHRPPGNPSNYQTLCVNINSLPAHIAHGDVIGPCIGCEEESIVDDPNNENDHAVNRDDEHDHSHASFNLFPNPVEDNFTIQFNDFHAGEGQLFIYNSVGALVWSNVIDDMETTTTLKVSTNDFTAAVPGVYIVKVSQGDHQLMKKIMLK